MYTYYPAVREKSKFDNFLSKTDATEYHFTNTVILPVRAVISSDAEDGRERDSV